MPVNDEVCFSNEEYLKRGEDLSEKNHHSFFSGLAVIVHQLEIIIFRSVKKYCPNYKDIYSEHFFYNLF